MKKVRNLITMHAFGDTNLSYLSLIHDVLNSPCGSLFNRKHKYYTMHQKNHFQVIA